MAEQRRGRGGRADGDGRVQQPDGDRKGPLTHAGCLSIITEYTCCRCGKDGGSDTLLYREGQEYRPE